MRRRVTTFVLMIAAGGLCAVRPALGQVGQVGSGNAIGTSLTVSTLATGATLSVGAAVSADGRYVTMSIQPSFASLEGFDTFTGGGLSSGGAGGTVMASGLHAIPFRPAVVGKVTLVENDKKLLGKTVKAATWKDTSLKAAARKLADAADTNVVLGIRGLEQAGVDVNAPHTFVIDSGTLKDAVLAVVKNALPEQDMVVTADEGVVQIGTQGQADNAVVTRSYYLDDVLANLPRVVPASMDLGTLKDDKVPATDAKAQGARAGAAGRTAAAKAPAGGASADVARLIAASVRPEIWKINGGKIGEIAVVGNRVIVTAPQSVQAILDGPTHGNHNAVPLYIGVRQ